jgi:TldD protein
MEDLTRKAIETALSSGATYADMRIVEINTQNISTRNGKIRNVSIDKNRGFGVRVLIDGAWGFSSSCEIDPGNIEKVTLEAAKIARASAKLKKKDVKLAPTKPIRGTYRTPLKKNPFEVPLEEKIEVLVDADKRVISQSDLLKLSASSMSSHRENKVFANSEGAYITQEITWCGANSRAVAVGYGEFQDRSFDGRNSRTGGYEVVEEIDLPARAEESGKEALKLLTAKNCPEMTTDVIIGGSQLALQVHESTGHPMELDRALGAEAAYAGTSFLQSISWTSSDTAARR